MARPSLYSADLVDSICERIAEGESLLAIVRDDGIPDYRTINRWLAKHDEFRLKYARAREASADADADKINDIAARTLFGEFDPQAARVAIDALKWSAGKRQPRKYGDRLELAGDPDRPIAVQQVERKVVKPQ